MSTQFKACASMESSAAGCGVENSPTRVGDKMMSCGQAHDRDCSRLSMLDARRCRATSRSAAVSAGCLPIGSRHHRDSGVMTTTFAAPDSRMNSLLARPSVLCWRHRNFASNLAHRLQPDLAPTWGRPLADWLPFCPDQ